MTRQADDNHLADALASLDGSRIEDGVGDTLILVSTDEEEWPHVALLSVGEVLAMGTGPDAEVRIALWPNTAATRNLTRTGKALLAIIGRQRCLYLRLAIRRGPDLHPTKGGLAAFAATIERAVEDEVGYALITTGIRFDLRDQPDTLERWQRTVAALREADFAEGWVPSGG